MSGATPGVIFGLLKTQLTYHPPLVTSSFEGQTIICTGGNAGLGKDAIRQMLELKAGKIIMAVRSISKGETARQELERTGRKGVIEVWPIDLANYASVIAFAERANGLDRLDAVIANAGMWPTGHSTAEGHEVTITTNVISTMLFSYLLLPKLRQTAQEKDTTTRLTTLGSGLHKFATLKARKDDNVFQALDAEALKDESAYDMRYNDSKMLLQICTQTLAKRHEAKYGNGVCVNIVNPGYCVSALKPPKSFGQRQGEKMLARTTEEGGIALVDAVALDKAAGRNGQYIDECRVNKASPWLGSDDGKKTSIRVWEEIQEMMNEIVPGLSETV